MPIKFNCTYCTQRISIGSRKAGTTIECPTCKGSQLVPAVSSGQHGNTLAMGPPSHTDLSLSLLEPGQPEPAKPEPASLEELVQSEPAPSELAQSESAQSESAQSELAQSELVQPESAQLEPAQLEPARLEPELIQPPDKPPKGYRFAVAATLLLVVGGLMALPFVLHHFAEEPTPPPVVVLADQKKEPPPPPPVLPPSVVPRPEPKPVPPPVEVRPIDPDPMPKEPVKPAPEVKPEPKPEPPAVKDPEPAPAKVVKLKRRSQVTEDALRRQLLDSRNVPVLALNAVPDASKMVIDNAKSKTGIPISNVGAFLTNRADLMGLPMRSGGDCHLGEDTAKDLQVLSRALRSHLEASIKIGPNGTIDDPRPNKDILRGRLLNDKENGIWLKPAAIPTLLQMLMAEGRDIRRLLVDLLAQIEGPEASVALAKRAIVDLNPDVREAAVMALKPRKVEEYLPTLLAGFQYPWPAFADHASEAIVALDLKDASSKLTMLLEGTDVSRPVRGVFNGQPVMLRQELVQINHLGNCLMCHAPSLKRTDLVRARVPVAGLALPAPSAPTKYYEADGPGGFVRADITYLKQDFSLSQPVERADTWPEYQRFDYLVRVRPLTDLEIALWRQGNPLTTGVSDRNKALLYALRELNRKEEMPAALADDWLRLYMPITGELAAKPLTDAERVEHVTDLLVNAEVKKQEDVFNRLKDSEGAVYDLALARAIPKLTVALQSKGRSALVERLSWIPLNDLRAKIKDGSGELRRAAILACGLRAVPALADDLKPLLKETDPEVVEAASTALSLIDPRFHSDLEINRMSKKLVEASIPELAEMFQRYDELKGSNYDLALAKALPRLPRESKIQSAWRDKLMQRLSKLPGEELRGHVRNLEDREMRLAAVRASKSKNGDDALVTALIPRLNDKDDTIVYEAAKTLSSLLQQRIDGPEWIGPLANRAETVQHWQEWWKKKQAGK